MQLVYLSDQTYSSSLSHHGILGMKWGDKNGPPYPLGSKDHSASEKKAGWRKSLDSDSKQKTAKKRSDFDSKSFKKRIRESRERETQLYEKTLPKEHSSDSNKSSKHTLSDAQKKKIRNVAIGVAVAAGIGVGMYFAFKQHGIDSIAQTLSSAKGPVDKSALKETMLRSLDESTMVFDKGSIFHRMSAYGGLDYSKATDPMFVSWKKADVATYMTMLKDWSGTGKRYDVVFEALHDIKAPTKQKAKEVFEQLWSEDPEYRKTLRNTLVETYEKLFKAPRDICEAKADMDLKSDPFAKAMYAIVRKGSDSKTLIDKFKSLGYDAIEDYFDKGELAESPLILFNPSNSILKKGESFVTKEMKIQTLKELESDGIEKIGAGKYYVSDVLQYVDWGIV